MTPEQKLVAVHEALYPEGDPDHQWSPDTTMAVANAVGGRRPSGNTPAAKAVREIVEILYPRDDPDRSWDADTIENVAWVVEDYNSTHDPLKSIAKNPERAGLVRGVITLGLAALGVTGVVMGIREAKRSW